MSFLLLFLFFSYKIREQDCRTGPALGWKLVPVGGEGFKERGEEGEHNICSTCVHIYINVKTITLENVPGMGEKGDIEELWRGEFKYDTYYKILAK
jgi:hypothetical protein